MGKGGTSMEKLDLDEESLPNIDVILLIFQLYETNISILKQPLPKKLNICMISSLLSHF